MNRGAGRCAVLGQRAQSWSNKSIQNGSASFRIPPAPVVRITIPAGGFDWGDAGIGAAGGVALAMLGLGGGLVISNHRPRRGRHTTAQL